MSAHTQQTTSQDAAVKAAACAVELYRRGIELLAAGMDGPRQWRSAIDAAGITADDLEGDDSRAIFGVLRAAGDPTWGLKPWSKNEIAFGCKRALQKIDAWDEADTRRFCTGSGKWSPASFSAFTAAVRLDLSVVRQAIDRFKAARSAFAQLRPEDQ